MKANWDRITRVSPSGFPALMMIMPRMLYDDIAQAQINLNAPGAEVDNFTVLSTDNDTARVLAYGDNSSSESGSTGNFSIRLQTQPLNAVTVSFGDNDSSGRQLGLGFSPDNITSVRTTGPHREQSSSPPWMTMWTKEPRVLTTRASPH